MPESPRRRHSPDDSRGFSVASPWRPAVLSPIVRSGRATFLVAILVSLLFAAMPSTNAVREPAVPSTTVVDVAPGGDVDDGRRWDRRLPNGVRGWHRGEKERHEDRD